jgi:hypothetical protein
VIPLGTADGAPAQAAAEPLPALVVQELAAGAPVQISAAGDGPLTLRTFDCSQPVPVNTDTLIVKMAATYAPGATAVLYLDGEPLKSVAGDRAQLEALSCQTYSFRIADRVPPGVYSATVAMAVDDGACTTLTEQSAPITFRYQPHRGNVQLVRTHRRQRGEHHDHQGGRSSHAQGPAPDVQAAVLRDRIDRLLSNVRAQFKTANEAAETARGKLIEATKKFVKAAQPDHQRRLKLQVTESLLAEAKAKFQEEEQKEKSFKDSHTTVAAGNLPNEAEVLTVLEEARKHAEEEREKWKTKMTELEAKKGELQRQVTDPAALDPLTVEVEKATKDFEQKKAHADNLRRRLEQLEESLNQAFPSLKTPTPAPAEEATKEERPAPAADGESATSPPETTSVAVGASEEIATVAAESTRIWVSGRMPGAFDRLAHVRPLDSDVGDDFPRAADLPLTIYEYRFHAPAHIAWTRFNPLGVPLQRTGVVIYEGMQFAARDDGTYEVSYDVQTPEAPVDLRLQLEFQNAADQRWHTITLPPVRLQTSIFESDGAQVRRIVQRGYSSALEMAPLNDAFELRRSGTAMIGFGAKQYRPQTDL